MQIKLPQSRLARKIVTAVTNISLKEKTPTEPGQNYNQVPMSPKRYTLQDKVMMLTGAGVCAVTLWFVPGIFRGIVSIETQTKPKQIAQSTVVVTLPKIHGGNTAHTAISTVFTIAALAYIFQNDLRNLLVAKCWDYFRGFQRVQKKFTQLKFMKMANSIKFCQLKRKTGLML